MEMYNKINTIINKDKMTINRHNKTINNCHLKTYKMILTILNTSKCFNSKKRNSTTMQSNKKQQMILN